MDLVAAFFLHLIHLIYVLVVLVHSCWKLLTWKPPQPLEAARRRVPKHLAILLVAESSSPPEEVEEVLLQSVVKAVGWCRIVGVEKLTVYDEHGVLVNSSQQIRECLLADDSDVDSSESEIDYPLTPPPSDDADSRPISPQTGSLYDMSTVTIHLADKIARYKSQARKKGLHRRKYGHCKPVSQTPLSLCLASRKSSKPVVAAVASSLAVLQKRNSRKGAKHPFTLSVDALHSLLESDGDLSSPDFMIVHPVNPLHYNWTPFELHGYPPWQIRLTEIYHDRFQDPRARLNRLIYPLANSALTPLNEIAFRQALDEFGMAEMRFGK